jgi:hypothetical protein
MITPVISDIRWLACQQFVVVIHADDANHLVLGGSDTVLGFGEIILAQMTQTQNSFQMRRDSVSTRRTSSFSDQSSQVGLPIFTCSPEPHLSTIPSPSSILRDVFCGPFTMKELAWHRERLFFSFFFLLLHITGRS